MMREIVEVIIKTIEAEEVKEKSRIRIKECPHCAGTARVNGNMMGKYTVYCSECGCSGPLRRNVVDAVNIWNCRMPEEVAPGAVVLDEKELKELNIQSYSKFQKRIVKELSVFKDAGIELSVSDLELILTKVGEEIGCSHRY